MADIIYCLGSRLVKMFCSFLAKDFKQWRSGMPDLILWKEVGGIGKAKFVEVKSENDTLSE